LYEQPVPAPQQRVAPHCSSPGLQQTKPGGVLHSPWQQVYPMPESHVVPSGAARHWPPWQVWHEPQVVPSWKGWHWPLTHSAHAPQSPWTQVPTHLHWVLSKCWPLGQVVLTQLPSQQVFPDSQQLRLSLEPQVWPVGQQ
jgi:hypothetical protein